jgi:hypothetical protein
VRQIPPTGVSDADRDFAIRELINGRNNATGSVTLTVSATTTTVTRTNASKDAIVLLFPTTANAAGALATTYISEVTRTGFTITHANAATADRTFYYVMVGG